MYRIPDIREMEVCAGADTQITANNHRNSRSVAGMAALLFLNGIAESVDDVFIIGVYHTLV